MAQKKPTHAQAQLQLQLYDLRREAQLRKAREWFLGKYHARTLEEAFQLTPPGSRESAMARMVTTYWDQACAYLNYGLLHEGLFFESTGEFFSVYEQLRPFLPALRRRYKHKHLYEHLERAALRYEKWMSRRAPGWMKDAREGRVENRKGRNRS
ncbi:MAG: DUF4760 domain-containing protein [Candidatus Acidiferrales bacterium]